MQQQDPFRPDGGGRDEPPGDAAERDRRRPAADVSNAGVRAALLVVCGLLALLVVRAVLGTLLRLAVAACVLHTASCVYRARRRWARPARRLAACASAAARLAGLDGALGALAGACRRWAGLAAAGDGNARPPRRGRRRGNATAAA